MCTGMLISYLVIRLWYVLGLNFDDFVFSTDLHALRSSLLVDLRIILKLGHCMTTSCEESYSFQLILLLIFFNIATELVELVLSEVAL